MLGFQRLGQELAAAMADNQGTFTERLTVFAQTYVRFASRQPAPLDLMFTASSGPEQTHRCARPTTAHSQDRPHSSRMLQANRELIAEDPDRIEIAVLATLQGLAWLANSSVTGDRGIDTVVAQTIETPTNGLKPTPS